MSQKRRLSDLHEGEEDPKQKAIAKAVKALPALDVNLSDAEKDDELALRGMLSTILNDCLTDSKYILSLHNHHQQRKVQTQKKEKQDSYSLPSDMVKASKIPEHVKIFKLAEMGDLTSDDIIGVRKFDKASDQQLLRYACGLDKGCALSHHFSLPGVL